MVDCYDNNELNLSGSLTLAKLFPTNCQMQPVIACSCKNPTTTTTTITLPCSITPPQLNHHQGKGSEKGMIVVNEEEQPSVASARWSPTPEQLMALEEMYRCGTKTPTADQIQQIAAQLRRFGKIEGKNVFYWFQNHKARERQKRRRRQNHNAQNPDKKDSGGKRTNTELEQTKNMASLSPCNNHFEGLSLPGAAIIAAEQQLHGLQQKGERKLQEKDSTQQENSKQYSTWQTMNWSTVTTTTAAQVMKFYTPIFLLKTKEEDPIQTPHEDEEMREDQTLQLFPLIPCSEGALVCKRDRKVPIRAINTNFSPNQFFEFLPLKN
ncbi:hypothetical protein Tsubulata_021431 [Turnera subulata]|uniref:Homeobox domain-containing protein n=1 Tax=Turnera subulata TaxID=218843 RepID=A0A9Q0FZT5_9ROSI|nr:hypothetical protein Tsubulata_021431 [Turnera subulata]